ncbi:cyclic di-GMP phosphodiesterase [Serratia sp. UGAL515B_01]|uniref:cyclic di-GMP phosphodiesterase n=1 Tax=Serratia sp. UGAL515B_01 TaxID=2986763 RepID=UPI002953CE7E|nr:cyclic di-GMP phosphodiesterase [Serratia sp. UGAL515B_01]WON75579.1 cyclic di-GMP phosphodiesterase [Serratia sp. UGAL515B_01]
MGLKKAFAHHASYRRRNLTKSSLTALAFFAISTAVSLFLIYHQRTQHQLEVERRTQEFTVNYLDNLKSVMLQIMPLADKSCETTFPDLAYRAAFTSGVRTFILVNDGIAHCSSATGKMRLEVNHLYPEIDWYKQLDMKLQQGTPIVPEKPVVAVWLRQQGQSNTGVLATLDLSLTPYLLLTSHSSDTSGMAIIMGKQVVTTFSTNLIPFGKLPQSHASQLAIPNYPVKIMFYHRNLTADDIRLTLLASLVLSLMIGMLFYSILMLRQSPERALMRGIKRNEFFVEYQPVFHAVDKSISGIEALIRWQHPTEGRIPPDLFIPFAESEGLIVPLTRHLFNMVVAELTLLVQVLPRGTKLNINLAPSHLKARSFHDDVNDLLTRLPQNHFVLVFEITERGMVEEKNAVKEFGWLHQQGIQIAVDDFGTGHSALVYLQRFNLDYLKIDQGFVNSISQETITAPVLNAIISLAKRLKMQTIAEGVETVEQVKFLQQQGVNFMQGYYLSKPLGIEALVAFCQKNCVFEHLEPFKA